MKKFLIVLIFCMVIFGACQSSDPEQLVVEEMRSDFAVLYQSIIPRHPDEYAYTSEEEFALIYDELASEINDDISYEDFYRLCVQMGSLIGDCHVWVGMPAADIRAFEQNAKLFPGIIRAIDGKYYLTARLDGGSEGVGAEIVGISDFAIEDIRDDLMDYLSADGNQEAPKDYMLFERGLFAKYYSLYLNSDQSTYILELDGEEGSAMLTIEGVSISELRAYIDQHRPPDYQYELIADDIAYIRIHSFAFYGTLEGLAFNRFLSNTFEDINELEVPNLIIDVRGNDGGDPSACVEVLNYIMPEDYTYFDNGAGYPGLSRPIEVYDERYLGDVYVLQDEGTFSSTGHFLSLIKEHGVGMLVGQQSGSTFTCNDNAQEFVLDHSKIRINLSTQTYSTTAQGLTKGAGILPDLVVSKSLEGILNDRDTVLEYCLSYIRD